jgi:hypothetical protein
VDEQIVEEFASSQGKQVTFMQHSDQEDKLPSRQPISARTIAASGKGKESAIRDEEHKSPPMESSGTLGPSF